MRGCVFSIEEFSVYDGPGIRTSVFLKGCPLRCSWCHNPEGQQKHVQIVKSPNGCIGCGACIQNAEHNGNDIVYTQESIKKCPMQLLRVCGAFYESAALCETLLKNERILKNGGGVTFSGGEPLAQSAFVFECLERLKGRLHTAIQTSGYCSERVFEAALQRADFFLYDLKLIDGKLHQKYTGVDNVPILKNFKALAQSKKSFIIRVPLIPTVTDTEENLSSIAKLLRGNDVQYVELLPYNKMAGGKYKLVGRTYTPGFDETQAVRVRGEIFDTYGIEIKVL